MGGSLEVSAFRGTDLAGIADLIVSYMARGGVRARVEPWSNHDGRNGIDVFSPTAGWTLVFWPSLGTNIAMDVTAEISGQTGAVASCVSAYDGDLWSHLLFDRGTLRDRFCSRPDYFEEESGNAADLVRRWTGDPETVAAILEVSLAEVAPYLRPLSDDDFESGDEIRAHPDDESTLDDFWVFSDFWRRIGITYPDADARASLVIALEFGWDTKLEPETQWTV